MGSSDWTASNCAGQLHVYGPGGPYKPMKECGEIFSQRYHLSANVTKGVPESWIDQAMLNADLIFGGAEYMLVDFNRAYPHPIEMTTVQNLYPRQIGVILRKGNPLKIRSISDLGKEGIRLLDVVLERMGAFQSAGIGPDRRIARSVRTGEEGMTTWLADRELDAWITYRSWHITMKDETEFLALDQLPDARRFTPIALARRCEQRENARSFINFLKSDEGHQVFARYGWE